jgi:hypothetical protein
MALLMTCLCHRFSMIRADGGKERFDRVLPGYALGSKASGCFWMELRRARRFHVSGAEEHEGDAVGDCGAEL